MTDPEQQQRRRLPLLATLLAAFAFSIIFILIVPLRVAECGPPDPYLLRYLGAPFFHSTGYGAGSSLEARIWAGPWIANIGVIAALVFGVGVVAQRRRRKAPNPVLVWGVIGVSAALIIGAGRIIVVAHSVQWTLDSPEVTEQDCDIRFDPFTEPRAWVRPAGP